MNSSAGECVPWGRESRRRGLMAPRLSVIRRRNHLLRVRGKEGTLVTGPRQMLTGSAEGPVELEEVTRVWPLGHQTTGV